MLPEKAVEILKVIKKKDINQYIDKDNCLASWGGNDNYQFTFVPQKLPNSIGGQLSNGSVTHSSEELYNNLNDKKVRAKTFVAFTSRHILLCVIKYVNRNFYIHTYVFVI